MDALLSPDRPARAALLKDLRALIVNGTPGLTEPLDEDAPLITSGVLESTTLVSVVLWVEDRVGRELDLAALDLVSEWDSLNAILDFIERHTATAGSPRDRV